MACWRWRRAPSSSCFVIAAFVGITIGLEGYQGLQIIGLAPLAGYLSSYANTREIAPLITAFGLAAQMGCKFTTQLGAMRITEEIDALEVMSIRSLPYLVTTRLIAALVVVTPLYLIALSGAYLATQITVIIVAHQGSGTYAHYFHAFLTAPRHLPLHDQGLGVRRPHHDHALLLRLHRAAGAPSRSAGPPAAPSAPASW